MYTHDNYEFDYTNIGFTASRLHGFTDQITVFPLIKDTDTLLLKFYVL